MVITFRDPEVKWQINAQHNEERLSRGPAHVLLASLPIEIDYSLRAEGVSLLLTYPTLGG